MCVRVMHGNHRAILKAVYSPRCIAPAVRVGIRGKTFYLAPFSMCVSDSSLLLLFLLLLLLVFISQELPGLTKHEDHDWKDVDCVFCCLPHATTQEIIMQLPQHVKARGVYRTRSSHFVFRQALYFFFV